MRCALHSRAAFRGIAFGHSLKLWALHRHLLLRHKVYTLSIGSLLARCKGCEAADKMEAI